MTIEQAIAESRLAAPAPVPAGRALRRLVLELERVTEERDALTDMLAREMGERRAPE